VKDASNREQRHLTHPHTNFDAELDPMSHLRLVKHLLNQDPALYRPSCYCCKAFLVLGNIHRGLACRGSGKGTCDHAMKLGVICAFHILAA